MADDDALPVEAPTERTLTPTPADTTPSLPALTAEEYFSDVDLKGRDVGRVPRVASKVYICAHQIIILILYGYWD